MRSRNGWFGAAMLVWVLACGTAWAQIGSSQVNGFIVDANHAPVPGAAVVVTNLDTAFSRTAMTTDAGAFTVGGVPPGPYRVAVELQGFRPISRDGVKLETGETVRLDFELSVGGPSERIEVTADAPVLRANANLGSVVSEEKVVALPLNGRTFITLAALSPGVALPPNSQLPRINGGRPRTNEYLFDGISVLQPEPGHVAFFPNDGRCLIRVRCLDSDRTGRQLSGRRQL